MSEDVDALKAKRIRLPEMSSTEKNLAALADKIFSISRLTVPIKWGGFPKE